MNPFQLLVLALLTPFVLLITLLGPLYGTMCTAAYYIYDKGTSPHPLAGKFSDPFYIVDVYSQLFSYWKANMMTLSFFHYTLPVAILPLAGLLLGIWLTRKIAKKLMEIFHLFGGH